MGELSRSSREKLVGRFQRLDRSWSAIQRSDDLHELKRGIVELHVDDVAHLPLWIRVWGLDRQSEIESIESGLRSDVELALASFSADGYIRAAAIDALSRSAWRLARAFVMIRLADWVPQVAELACRATRKWLFAGAASERFAEWAVFASICRRDIRGRAMELFDELYSEPDRGPVWMIEQVNASGHGADAAWVVAQILQRASDHASLIPHLVRSPFDVVRVIGTRAARTTGEFLVTRALMDVLSDDSSPGVRREAVYLLERAEDGIARPALNTLAGDRSAAVRQSALYYLEHRFGADRRQLARQKLSSSIPAERAQGAVDFCAVARADDIAELRVLASGGPARVRVAAMLALHRLGSWHVPDDVLAFALDRSAPVARQAVRLTDGRECALSMAAWSWIVRQAPVYAVRHAAAVRACVGHPFDGLALLMRECVSIAQPPEVRQKFASAIAVWSRPTYLKVSESAKEALAESWKLLGVESMLSRSATILLDELKIRARKPHEPL